MASQCSHSRLIGSKHIFFFWQSTLSTLSSSFLRQSEALFCPFLSKPVLCPNYARYAFGHGGTVGGGSPTPRRGNAPGTPSLTCPHRSANAIACSAASTVAELRRAEQPPPPSSPPRRAPVPNKRKVLKTKRTATLGLAKSRRQGASRKLCRGRAGNPPSPFYCCEKRITISTSHCIGGHHCPVDRLYQVSVRCGPRRHRAVADTEMTSKKKVLQLSPGLPGKSYLHWAVQPDPTIGEPFSGSVENAFAQRGSAASSS